VSCGVETLRNSAGLTTRRLRGRDVKTLQKRGNEERLKTGGCSGLSRGQTHEKNIKSGRTVTKDPKEISPRECGKGTKRGSIWWGCDRQEGGGCFFPVDVKEKDKT